MLSDSMSNSRVHFTTTIQWAEIFLGHLLQNECSQKILFVETAIF